jgi:hypothetical protein
MLMAVDEAEAALRAAVEKAARRIVLEPQRHVFRLRCYTQTAEAGLEEIVGMADLLLSAALSRCVVSVGAWPTIEQLYTPLGSPAVELLEPWRTTATCNLQVLKGT